MLYRPWCLVSVEASGKEDPRVSKTEGEIQGGLPRVSMDYADVGNGDVRSQARKLSVGKDELIKGALSSLVYL